MLSDARHTQIVKYLEAHHSASVQDLARDLYASPSTIRRDLSELEALGFLRRVHGGAVLTTGSTFDTPEACAVPNSWRKNSGLPTLPPAFSPPPAPISSIPAPPPPFSP